MTNVYFNPPGIKKEYLCGLNACFGHWGDKKSFDWVFGRKLSFPDTDLMIVTDDNQELLAGSGITYRLLKLPNGNSITIGIMTGSWTLPAARCKGCFTRIIESSLEQTATRGGALLIAFVTQDNASTRRLTAAGSLLVPGYYIFSTPETPCPQNSGRLETVSPSGDTIAEIREISSSAGINRVHFVYPRTEDFLSQIVDRPDSTTILRDPCGNMAVVESVGETDRLQYLALSTKKPADVCSFLTSMLAFVLGKERKMFLYTADRTTLDAAQKLGMGHKPGYITLLTADDRLLQRAVRDGSGKKGREQPAPADTGEYPFTGQWHVHSGDRA